MSAAALQSAQVHPSALAPSTQVTSDVLRKLKFTVAGDLISDAEVRTTRNGSAEMVIQIRQPGGGLPFVATLCTDQLDAAQLYRLAASLRQGLTALVVGVGLRVTSFDEHPALTADHVISINRLIAEHFFNDLDRFEEQQ